MVVFTKPRAEVYVYMGLASMMMGAFYPAECLSIKHRGRERCVIARPLFPGLLFVRCERTHIGRIREIDGVQDVLRQDGKVCRVSEELVGALKWAQDIGAFDRDDNRVKGGDITRVSGQFAGCVERLRKVGPKARVALLLDCICKVAPIGVDSVKRASPTATSSPRDLVTTG
jgi:transcription antitermination factor NusG